MTWQVLRADMHVHTALSPCAEPEMTPAAIVARALEVGLDIVAILDHNSGKNVVAVMSAARRSAGSELMVLPGIELCTAEEVHICCYFQSPEALAVFEGLLSPHLSSAKNRPEYFGAQALYGIEGNQIGEEDQMLLAATDLTVGEAVTAVRDCGGLPVAAHVDRPAYSLVAQLGLIPEGLDLAAAEVSRHYLRAGSAQQVAEGHLPLIASSDAHRLRDIGSAGTEFRVREISFDEIEKALASRRGRRVKRLWFEQTEGGTKQ